MRERSPRLRHAAPIDLSEAEDYMQGESREVRTLFAKLPPELRQRHLKELERIDTEAADAGIETLAHRKAEYLSGILEARRIGLEEYKSNDPEFARKSAERELGNRLQDLLESSENMLGAGQTARVKRLSFPDGSTAAVKYLLTPTQKTLSAEGEHDMLYEVETMTRIESEEKRRDADKRIHVPHPYFFYKREHLQCYGMQEIIGMTIEELLGEQVPHTVALVDQREKVRGALRERYASASERDALYAELALFTQAMHEVCLHGDIKPANMMADEKGDIYLIDFGQSVDANLMTDKSREQFENLQALETEQLVSCIRKLLRGIESA